MRGAIAGGSHGSPVLENAAEHQHRAGFGTSGFGTRLISLNGAKSNNLIVLVVRGSGVSKCR